mgnify:CR=1 FL=1
MSANTNPVLATDLEIRSLLNHDLEVGGCDVVRIGLWQRASEV